MTKATEKMEEQAAPLTPLEIMRLPTPPELIGKLPRPTEAQTNCKYEQKRRCGICEGFHHPDVVHLDYVGHAAITNRLLEADINWNWEPLSFTETGIPRFDESGGLWIKLTIGGQTRLGYGNAAKSKYKSIGDREKECIGDALRNAAMRFGSGLEMWHKGDLHAQVSQDHESGLESNSGPPEEVPDISPQSKSGKKRFEDYFKDMKANTTPTGFRFWCDENGDGMKNDLNPTQFKAMQAAALKHADLLDRENAEEVKE